jgi:ATP-dependent DNA helicase HFM1/MER3
LQLFFRPNHFIFDKGLNYKLFDQITEFSGGQPTIVFCNTRKGTVDAAKAILESLSRRQQHSPDGFVDSEGQLKRLQQAQQRAKNKGFRELVVKGIGIHHAGMEFSDRQMVETLFKNKDLLVICATCTLAQGINLPAHLVIVKSTKVMKFCVSTCIGTNNIFVLSALRCSKRLGRIQ